MWIDKNTLPNTIDAEIPLLLLLKQDNSGFCGMPITYHQRIVKGWYVSSKRILVGSITTSCNSFNIPAA